MDYQGIEPCGAWIGSRHRNHRSPRLVLPSVVRRCGGFFFDQSVQYLYLIGNGILDYCTEFHTCVMLVVSGVSSVRMSGRARLPPARV